jgi:hypothetical protein
VSRSTWWRARAPVRWPSTTGWRFTRAAPAPLDEFERERDGRGAPP